MERIISNYFVTFILLVSGATAKTVLDTDLTSDFTSTNNNNNDYDDDQYPWSSALPPRGPNYQDTTTTTNIESNYWLSRINNIHDDLPINRYYQSILKKQPSSINHIKELPRTISSVDEYQEEDKDQGLLKINNSNKLMKMDKLNLAEKRNKKHEEEIKVEKSIKAPKNLQVEMKKRKKKLYEHSKNFKVDDDKKKRVKKNYFFLTPLNTVDAVRLKIDIENQEKEEEDEKKQVLKKSVIRDKRSVPIDKNNKTSKNENKYIESSEPVALRVTPVTLDLYYDSDEYDFIEEMDELLKIKKEEEKMNNKKKNRGDMDPEMSSPSELIIIDDGKLVPTRGDIVERRVRSIDERNFNKKRRRRRRRERVNVVPEEKKNNNNDNVWGFGEDDGMISDDEDNESSINTPNNLRIKEEEKRRREWERRRHEEIERRKIEEISRKDDNRIKTEIDSIKIEYERKLERERQEQERKLRAYIERNRPIVVNNNRAELLRRRNDANVGHSGNSQTSREDSRKTYEDRMQKYREELARRNSQNNKPRDSSSSSSSSGNLRGNNNSPNHSRGPSSSSRDYSHEQDNEGDNERRQEEYKRQESLRRYYEDIKRHNNYAEQKRQNIGVISLTEIEQKKNDEDRRLKSLPVSAKIIIVPNSSKTNISTRGFFDEDDSLPAINPNRPGLEAGNFPVAKTQRPPTRAPDACVWAIVQCCPRSNSRRLTNCFEDLGCPGVNWDPSPCRASIADAARNEIIRFYAMAN